MKLFCFVVGLSIVQLVTASTNIPTLAGAWCSHAGATIVPGDFDGDDYDDVMCYDTNGNYWVRYAKVFKQDEQFLSMANWCNHAGAKRYIGDFNGDHRDDLLCHDSAGQFWIALADAQGKFQTTSWHAALGWCAQPLQLHVGDFNGDGKADVLCHHPTTGYKWVAINAGAATYFTVTSWQHAMGWCYHGGSQLFVGDFNGDGKDDILCHDSQGQKWIAYATYSGCSFTGFTQGFYRNMGWCYHAGAVLRIGYMNNDKYADFICHDTAGSTWTAINDPVLRFDIPLTGHFTFCAGPNERFLIGNFVATYKEEMLCTITGNWNILEDVA